MRLTNSDRDAFIIAVMDDVPRYDYAADAQKLVMERAAEKLPPKVREIWRNAELRGFIQCDTFVRTDCGTFRAPIDPQIEGADKTTLAYLAAKSKAQKSSRDELRSRVRAAIYSCTTLKQAKERLPEFAKYLPMDRDGYIDRSVPAISGLVADLSKAGRPKGQPKPEAKKSTKRAA
jgi:hypothetical protein